MAFEPSKKKVSYTTPAGEAVWPWINKPDTRLIKGMPQKPAYKLNIRYPANSPEWLELKATIDGLVEESYEDAIAKNPKKRKIITRQVPYVMETDDDGEETGTVLLKMKQSAFITRKGSDVADPVYIAKFDATGRPLKNTTQVYSGSIIKASFSTRPYLVDSTNGAGISMDLKSVQVLKLVSSTQRSAASYGFSVEEGYEPIEEDEDEESTVSSIDFGRLNASDPTDF